MIYLDSILLRIISIYLDSLLSSINKLDLN